MDLENEAILSMTGFDYHRMCLEDVLRRAKEPPNYGKIRFQGRNSEKNVKSYNTNEPFLDLLLKTVFFLKDFARY